MRAASTEALPPPASTWPPPALASSLAGALGGGAAAIEVVEGGLDSCPLAVEAGGGLDSSAASKSSLGRRAAPGDWEDLMADVWYSILSLNAVARLIAA